MLVHFQLIDKKQLRGKQIITDDWEEQLSTSNQYDDNIMYQW